MNKLIRIAIYLALLISLLTLAACSGFDLFPEDTPTPSHTPILVDTQIPPSTATYTPTLTLTPTATATPTLTNTPTPTAILLVETATAIPDILEVISMDNAVYVSALAEWVVDGLTDLAWTADSSSLAAATTDRIDLYDLPSRTISRSLYPSESGVRRLAFSPTGAWLVSSSWTGSEQVGYFTYLERWQGSDYEPLGVFGGEPRGLSDLDFSTNGLTLFAAYTAPLESENFIDFWDTRIWYPTITMRAGTVLDLALSPVGQLMATSPDRYAIYIWDLNATGIPLFTLHTSFTGAVTTAQFSPDSLMLASGHYDGQIKLWDTQTGTLIRTITTDAVIESLAFSPDGTLLATGSSYQDDFVRLWSVSSGELLRTLPGHDAGVEQILFSPVGDMLVTGSYDGLIRVWGIRP